VPEVRVRNALLPSPMNHIHNLQGFRPGHRRCVDKVPVMSLSVNVVTLQNQKRKWKSHGGRAGSREWPWKRIRIEMWRRITARMERPRRVSIPSNRDGGLRLSRIGVVGVNAFWGSDCAGLDESRRRDRMISHDYLASTFLIAPFWWLPDWPTKKNLCLLRTAITSSAVNRGVPRSPNGDLDQLCVLRN